MRWPPNKMRGIQSTNDAGEQTQVFRCRWCGALRSLSDVHVVNVCFLHVSLHDTHVKCPAIHAEQCVAVANLRLRL